MNKEKLIFRIDESGITRKSIACKLGISPNSLQNKITGRTEFNNSEVLRLSDILNLSLEEMGDIFFANRVYAEKTEEVKT